MKRLKIHIAILLLLSVVFTTEMIGQENPRASEFMLFNSTMGRDFWLAIPQNDLKSVGLREIGVEILVSSLKDIEVTMEIPSQSRIRKLNVKAGELAAFSTDLGDFGWDMEVIESEKVTDQGIHLYADFPFSVSVVNVRQYSGEGYSALPTKAWGTEYYHSAYYDFDEGNDERGGGFIVVASENATKVNILLDGEGLGFGQTVEGKELGETISVTLNAGQTYMVRGDGTTKGLFDLTGSRISANKPIGVVSFHLRTMIPSQCPEDRDNLCEMMLPVHTWGSEHVTVQFDRTTSGSREGKGDLFRIVASQDKTNLQCSYWDYNSYTQIGNYNVPLPKAGDFQEALPIKDINNSNKKTSIQGVAVWTTDKPVMINQYAFSYPWDGDRTWGPQQVLITPTSQYVPSAVFQTPLGTGFNENVLTFVALGDRNDPEYKLLKTIMIDGVQATSKDPKLTASNIPGTDYYWGRIALNRGTHVLESKTVLYGYMNGFASANSYGWPVGQGTDKIDGYDIVPPVIEVVRNCDTFTVVATEKSIGTVDPKQSDEGISEIILLDHRSNNFVLKLTDRDKFKPQLKITKQEFRLWPIDIKKEGKAVFGVLDRAGNLLIDSIMFYPVQLSLSKESLDFGKVRVNNSKELFTSVINAGSEDMEFISAEMKTGSYFSVSNPDHKNGFVVAANGEFQVPVKYNPGNEVLTNYDSDTLILKTACYSFKTFVKGVGTMPKITVGNIVFDSLLVRTEKCFEEQNSKGFKIDNPGTDTLTVSGIEGIEFPFEIKNATPAFPFKVAPGSNVFFKSICLFPQDTGSFTVNGNVVSDAMNESSNGEFTISARVYKEPDDTTGIFDVITSGELEIIPNPVDKSTMEIRFDKKSVSPSQIEIFDLLGNRILSRIFNETSTGKVRYSLELGKISKGTYLIVVKTGTDFNSGYFNVVK